MEVVTPPYNLIATDTEKLGKIPNRGGCFIPFCIEIPFILAFTEYAVAHIMISYIYSIWRVNYGEVEELVGVSAHEVHTVGAFGYAYGLCHGAVVFMRSVSWG